jgi:hypothetical protein
MIRIKRSVQATYNLRVNVTTQMAGGGKRADLSSSTLAGQKRPREEVGAMAELERQLEAAPVVVAPRTAVQFTEYVQTTIHCKHHDWHNL